jgi:hypothetical protein
MRPSGVLYTAVFVILQLRLPVVESKVRSMGKSGYKHGRASVKGYVLGNFALPYTMTVYSDSLRFCFAGLVRDGLSIRRPLKRSKCRMSINDSAFRRSLSWRQQRRGLEKRRDKGCLVSEFVAPWIMLAFV